MRALAFLLPILLAALPARADEPCRARSAPIINVSTRQEQPGQDYSQRIPDLLQMALNSDSAVEHGQMTLGLTRANFGYKTNYQLNLLKYADGHVCASVSEVDVEFVFAHTMVYVAADLPRGSCIFNEVYQHELRHVQVDTDLLQQWDPQFRYAVEQAVSRIGSFNSPSQEEAMTYVKSEMEFSLNNVNKSFMNERRWRQGQVDTHQEYERVSRACNGEAQRYMSAYR